MLTGEQMGLGSVAAAPGSGIQAAAKQMV